MGYAFEKESKKIKKRKKRKPILRRNQCVYTSARSIKTNKKLQSLIVVRFQKSREISKIEIQEEKKNWKR